MRPAAAAGGRYNDSNDLINVHAGTFKLLQESIYTGFPGARLISAGAWPAVGQRFDSPALSRHPGFESPPVNNDDFFFTTFGLEHKQLLSRIRRGSRNLRFSS